MFNQFAHTQCIQSNVPIVSIQHCFNFLILHNLSNYQFQNQVTSKILRCSPNEAMFSLRSLSFLFKKIKRRYVGLNIPLIAKNQHNMCISVIFDSLYLVFHSSNYVYHTIPFSRISCSVQLNVSSKILMPKDMMSHSKWPFSTYFSTKVHFLWESIARFWQTIPFLSFLRYARITWRGPI